MEINRLKGAIEALLFSAGKSLEIGELCSALEHDKETIKKVIDDMMFSSSLTDIFSAWILHLRKVMWYKPRMKPEREVIENADYILGRTTWDRAHSYTLNPNAKYYSCNRVLREPFYSEKWNIENIERPYWCR